MTKSIRNTIFGIIAAIAFVLTSLMIAGCDKVEDIESEVYSLSLVSNENDVMTYEIKIGDKVIGTFTVKNGVDGIDGINGQDGKDGTNGTDGQDGVDGKNGLNGIDGTNGLSAYELYLKYNGWYVGTEQQWITDLVNSALYTNVVDAINNCKDVKFVEDVTVTSMSLNNQTIDLNGHTLTVSDSFNIDGSVTIKNGTMNMTNAKSLSNINIYVSTGETLILDSVTLNVNGSGVGTNYTTEDSVQNIIVRNSKITSTGYYAISTNATTKSVVNNITIEDTIISVANNENDNCAVMFNTNGCLTLKNSTITGQRQAVIVRAGEAVIEDSTIVVVSSFTSDSRNTGVWSSGNEVSTGALIVGNKDCAGYNTTANVTIKNSTISGTNADGNEAQVYNVYVVETNTVGSVEYSATVTYIE